MDYWAYSNRFNTIHPVEKAMFSIVTMLIVLLFEKSLLHVMIFLCMVLLTVMGAGIPIKIYIKYLFIPLIFIITAMVSVALEFHADLGYFLYGTPIANVNIGVTSKSLFTSYELLFRSLAALACLYFLSLTTPMQEVIYLLERVHCPKIVTELMVLIYRFIFIFLVTAKNIYYAQSSRLGYKGYAKSLKSLSALCSALLVKTYLQSKKLYQATLSRGYQGTFHELENVKSLNVRRVVSIGLFEAGLIVIGSICR